jgi:hypothetical protein
MYIFTELRIGPVVRALLSTAVFRPVALQPENNNNNNNNNNNMWDTNFEVLTAVIVETAIF